MDYFKDELKFTKSTNIILFLNQNIQVESIRKKGKINCLPRFFSPRVFPVLFAVHLILFYMVQLVS